MPSRSTTTRSVVPLDFSGVESRGGKKGSGGGARRYPEGDYHVRCTEAKLGHSQDKETPRIEVIYKIMEGAQKGGTVRDDLYLTPKSLWKVRQTLEAMGIKVPSKAVNFDVKKMAGKELAVTLADDEYGDKVRSRCVDWYSLDEFEPGDAEDLDEDADDEEAEDTDDEDEEEEEEEESDDDDLEDLDLDEL